MEEELYEVACIQNSTQVVASNDPKEQDRIIEANSRRICELIEWTVHQSNGRAKLFLTGEYALTGTFRPRTVDEWMRLALPIPSEHTERLAQTARSYGCYIATQLMEIDPKFPGVFFDTAFIIGPSGDVILRYRKHNGPNNLNVQYVGPGDVYDRYVEVYGEKALFPVVDTPLGKLGCFICYDVNFPEVARCLTLNGAEVLLHLTASTLTLSQHWHEVIIARAWENSAYLASADAGPWTDSRWPVHFAQGNSMIVSYSGDTLARASGPGETVITAPIDIGALRRRRGARNAHQVNPYYQVRTELYGKEYLRATGWPNNAFTHQPMRDRSDAIEIAGAALERQVARGTLKGPGA